MHIKINKYLIVYARERKKNYTHGNTFFKKLDSVDEMWKEKINKKVSEYW